MALENEGIKPDALELRIRFGCGAALGVIVGASTALQIGEGGGPLVAAGALLGAVVGGVLARHFGDRFWRSLHRWL